MKRLIAFFALVLVIFTACDHESNKKLLVSDNFSNGKAGEVLLVVDKSKWNESQVDTIYNVLTQTQPGLNQNEPMFDVLLFDQVDFNSFFQRHRAIIHFKIDEKYNSAQLSIQKNVWAQPQVYIEVLGNDIDSCVALFLEREKELMYELYENDLKRIQNFYHSMPEKDIKKVVKEKFNINLAVPTQYFIANNQPDFLWLRYKTIKNDRFIMIYKTPATELNADTCIAIRNRMTQKYIPGAVDGAYPILAEERGYPLTNLAKVGRYQGVEMRGLWKSEGDHMGGPFYSFTFLDQKNNQLITVDGFVYAPQENKRDFLREVEAIVKSIQ